MVDKIKYWVETSVYDLKVAKSLFEKKHYLYVAFICRQSIEKILNIEARYPSYKDNISDSLTRKDAKNILLKSKEIIKWLKSLAN